MAGASIKVSLQGMAGVSAGLRALQRLGAEPASLLRPIGNALRQTTEERFMTGSDPEGQKWHAWTRAYAAVTKSSGVLRNRGMSGGLMGSLTFAVEGNSVRVGSNKEYAAVHQFGATIVPKRGKALRFMLGDRVVFAKKVTIPARPYLGFGPADKAAVHQVVHEALQRALAGRTR